MNRSDPNLSVQPFDSRQHLFPTPPPLQCPALRLFPMPRPPPFATDLLQKLTAAQNQLRLHMLPRTGLYSFPDRLLHILLIPRLSLPARSMRNGLAMPQ